MPMVRPPELRPTLPFVLDTPDKEYHRKERVHLPGCQHADFWSVWMPAKSLVMSGCALKLLQLPEDILYLTFWRSSCMISDRSARLQHQHYAAQSHTQDDFSIGLGSNQALLGSWAITPHFHALHAIATYCCCSASICLLHVRKQIDTGSELARAQQCCVLISVMLLLILCMA